MMGMLAMADGGYLVGNPLIGQGSGGMPAAQSFVGHWLTNSGPSEGPRIEATAALPKNSTDLSKSISTSKSDPYKNIKGSAGMLPGSGYVNGTDLNPDGTTSQAGGSADSLSNARMDGSFFAGDSGVEMAAKGGQIKKHLASKGGKVKADSPKQKATVKGNSYANDKIPAMLSEGEVVIRRKIMMHPEAPRKAAEFVAAIIAKKGLRK